MASNSVVLRKVPKLRFPGFSNEWKENPLSKFGKIITGSTPPTSDRSNYGTEFDFVDCLALAYVKAGQAGKLLSFDTALLKAVS